MEKKRILPPTFFMSVAAIIIVIHFILPVLKFIQFPWSLWGIPFLALGIILNLLADRHFKRFNVTVKPYEYSDKLIKNGVFRFTRNPMYLGMSSILLGESILCGSLSPFLIVIIFMLIIYFIFIKTEEKMLLEKFGEEYIMYKKRVRRWI
ncbi:MAG: isoprenylcysteine carboxylmethyltransferase family protein [Ignavibacteria bacterium]|jgi:protein-S-isoprenylcysteine O-methyltransferase Ste14